MFGGLGITELILILVVALVIFGPAKLPEIGKAVGKSLKEFKKETSNIMGDGDKAESKSTNEKKTEETPKPRETEADQLKEKDSEEDQK